MRFTMNKSELQNALTIVSKGLATRSTLPVLSGVLLQADQDSIVLQTTDLELSVQCAACALVEEPGQTVLPGKLLLDIVKTLPDAAVSVQATGDQADIRCDGASYSVKALVADDFPGFPHVEPSKRMTIPFTRFSSMVKRVARVVSRDETRAILTGVLIEQDAGSLRMVATDSYRLALCACALEDGAEDFSAVISGSFLQDVAGLPYSEEEVSVGVSENQIVVSYGSTVFVNRRIEGNFPNYRQLLPDSYVTRAEISREHLVAAVKRVSVLGSQAAPALFDVDADGGVVTLSATEQDVGSVSEAVPCTVHGPDVRIAFNCAYVLDGLSAITTDEVFLDLQSSMKPGILRAGEGEDFLYLVMPVRVA